MSWHIQLLEIIYCTIQLAVKPGSWVEIRFQFNKTSSFLSSFTSSQAHCEQVSFQAHSFTASKPKTHNHIQNLRSTTASRIQNMLQCSAAL